MRLISKEKIIEAQRRIINYVHRTPLISSATIASRSNTQRFWLKCENLQKVGAFKARGAFNKLLQLQGVKAVCTHSSGNHAQALAYAASVLRIPAYIVMPQNSPNVKKAAVRDYGAKVIESGNTLKDREETAERVSQEFGATFVHPYNDLDIIAGQATAALEVFEDLSNLDYLVFPIGGGGLSSGCVLATRYFGNGCKPHGVEPFLARDAKQSLESGSIQPQMPPISIADGLRTSLGPFTFEILNEHLTPNDVTLVSDREIVEAMKLVFERMKVVIEPSSATVVAAVLKEPRFRDKKVCCVVSGGNVDMSSYFDGLMATVRD